MPTKKHPSQEEDTDSGKKPQQPKKQNMPTKKQPSQQEDTDDYEQPKKPKKQKMSTKTQPLVILVFLELIHVPVILLVWERERKQSIYNTWEQNKV